MRRCLIGWLKASACGRGRRVLPSIWHGASTERLYAGHKVIIQFDSREQTAYVKGAQGEPVSSFVVFFADARAFYPYAPVFKAR